MKHTLKYCAVIVLLFLVRTCYAQEDTSPPTFIQEIPPVSAEDISTDVTFTIDWSTVWHPKSLDSEIECLANNIYWEAAREPEEGQIAVGLVTINRLKSGQYADTICGVVYQKMTGCRIGKLAWQFSWVPKVNRMKLRHRKLRLNQQAWAHAEEIARKLLANKSLDNVNDFTYGATHYYARYIKPPCWTKIYGKLTQIGLHIFYE